MKERTSSGPALFARSAPPAASPRIHDDPSLVAGFLADAAHVPGGHAAGVAFPASVAEVAALVRGARYVLPVGAQSSLTGGATPRGEIVISTRALRDIATPANGLVRVGVGVTLTELQERLAQDGLYYPPGPTYEGATVGGMIATNAAGAATFKYGVTRDWVSALTVVLANGDVLDISRGQITAQRGGVFEIVSPAGETARVPVPQYDMPAVPKVSAGYCSRTPLDLVDLFIGSEGTLGIVVEATLRVIPRPDRSVAIVVCRDESQAVALAGALRQHARAAWRGEGSLDVSAIEYIDAPALALTPDDAFARAGVRRPPEPATVLVLQIEIGADETAAFEALQDVLESCGVTNEPSIALPADERGARALLGLREAVPSAVNAAVAAAKAVDPGIEKTAGDMIVPFERVAESLALYRESFERRGLRFAIWGHLSDGNLHPNVVPSSMADVVLGREAILEIGRGVIALGGAPLAEHGVGRSALKQQLLREMYGEDGIEQMRQVKRALDPSWKLAPGVLFPASG